MNQKAVMTVSCSGPGVSSPTEAFASEQVPTAHHDACKRCNAVFTDFTAARIPNRTLKFVSEALCLDPPK